MISHCIDEAIRWSAGSILPDRHAHSLIKAITHEWIQHYDAPDLIIADGEKGLISEEVAQWLDRHNCQLKPKAPNEHAQMVERHHELLRRILLRVEAQLAEEGIHVSLDVILAACFLAKNCLLTVAGHTPYRGLYGRGPPGLAEFEPTSETQLDDASGGVPGYSRHHLRIREIAVGAMIQEAAQLRLERALASKTRLAAEQLELSQGDLVDFYRPPATKDESGWRGPAEVVQAPGPPIVFRWHVRHLSAC